MRVLSPTAAAQTPIKQKDPVRLPAMERAFLPARTNHCCALCSVITPTSDGHGRLDDTRTCSLDANRILFPRLSSPIPTHFSITTYLIQCAGAPLVLYQGGRLCAETCNPAMHPKTVGSRTSDTSCEHGGNPSQREPPFGKPLPAQTHPPAAFLRKPTSQLLIQSMTCKMQNSLSLYLKST